MNLFDLAAKISLDSTSFESGMQAAESKGSSFAQKLGGGLKTATVAIGAGLALAGTAVVKFGADAVQTGATFDKSMSQVAATMGLTVDEIQNLRSYAQEMGAETAFSASQAADALNYMALAGYDAQTSMEMLPNVLNLAAAGGIELARASDMVTDAQSALGLTLEDTTKMVDQMAVTSSKSNTSVAQLGDAILTIGATARDVKGGTTELTAVLGVLADNGIKGAEGGTKLRNMIMSLQNPTEEGAAALDALGVSVYDADGNMRSLIDIIGDIQVGLNGMDQASKNALISGIFNKQDVAAVNALLGTSRDRFDELTESITNADGAAKRMADTQLDNLTGDITLMKSALEGAKITLSDALTPALRNFVQFGTREIGKLDKAFQTGGINGLANQFGKSLGEAVKMIMAKIPDIVRVAGKLALSFAETIGSTITKNASKIIRTGLNVFKDLASSITKKIPDLMGGIGSLIGEVIGNIPNILRIGWDIAKGLAQGVIEGIPKFFAGIFDGFEDLFNPPTPEHTAMQDYLDDLYERLDSIGLSADEMYDKISGAHADAAQAEYWAGVFDRLHDKTKLTKDEQILLNQAVQYLNDNVLPETAKIIQDESGYWHGNTDEIYKNIDAMKARAIADVYFERANSTLREIAELQIGIDEKTTELLSLEGKRDALTPAIKNLSDAITKADADAVSLRGGVVGVSITTDQWTDSMWALAESIDYNVTETTEWDNVVLAAMEKQQGMQDELDHTNDDIQAHNDAIDDMTTKMGELNTQVDESIRHMTEWQGKAAEAGAAITDGFVQGMDSRIGSVYNKAGEIAGTAIDAMKAYALIASPSKKVRKEVGEMIGKGLELGLTDEIGAVEQASRQLSDAAMPDGAYSDGYNAGTSYATTAMPQRPIYLILDSGELVGRTATEMDYSLGQINTIKLRWEGAAI